MKFIMAVIVTLAAIALLVLPGCAHVVPDYNANRQKLGPPVEDSYTITWAPTTYPWFCTTSVTPDRQHFGMVSMFVKITGERRRVKIQLNDDLEMVWEPQDPATVHEFRWPAGAGKHYLAIWVLNDDGSLWKYTERAVNVVRCGKQTDQIQPAS